MTNIEDTKIVITLTTREWLQIAQTLLLSAERDDRLSAETLENFTNQFQLPGRRENDHAN
jgi:hypothetical protein